MRPAHVETRRVENNHDVRTDVNRTDANTRTENLRQGDLNNDGRRDV